jgi:predicted metal-dependent phosphoesterase TrpH
MTRKLSPLLCELHAHTTWSDGLLSVRQLVDLYGRAGFDVLAVTDHTARTESDSAHNTVDAPRYAEYLAAVEAEAERAREVFDLVVVPGLELTYDDPDPAHGAHAVAVGLRSFVGVDGGIEHALAAARSRGAALIAVHPYSVDAVHGAVRGTARFALEPEWAASVVDRFELVNRHDVFGWVAEAELPVVASGDFHRVEHLATWKTLLPCAKDEAAVVDYLRSARPVSLTRIESPALRSLVAA